MRRGRLTFLKPARRAEAFEAFFNHAVLRRWDTLLKVNYVEGGGTYARKLRHRWLGPVLDPIAGLIFAWETRRRFAAMARYLRRTDT
jgi:hypothetical protein